MGVQLVVMKIDTAGKGSVNKRANYHKAWETTTEFNPVDYDVDGIHVSLLPTDFKNVKVRPFTLKNFFAIEVGDQAFDIFMDEMTQEIGDTPLLNLFQDIENGVYDLNDLKQMEEVISNEMIKIIGPFQYLLEINRYNPLKYLEDKAADYIVGDNVDAVRKFTAKLKLPEIIFGDICEDYR